MLLKRLSICYTILACLTALTAITLPATALEVRAGNVVVKTRSGGETYIKTGRSSVYIPSHRYDPSDNYYFDDDYDDDYSDNDYRYYSRYRRTYPYYSCGSGRSVIRQRVGTSWSGRTIMRSSVYSKQCR